MPLTRLVESNANAAAIGRAAPVSRRADAAWFVFAAFAICFILQRFAIPAGGTLKINVATPAVVGLAMLGLVMGTLTLDRRRTALFLPFVGIGLLSFALSSNVFNPLTAPPKITSLANFLLVTCFPIFSFARPMDERRFFAIFQHLSLFIAAAGIAQFIAQFAGVSIFAFAGIIPEQFLVEELYNLQNAIGGTSLFKSNGFFLIESSAFSRIMALAIGVEIMLFKRPYALGLLFGGLVCSVAGMGWIVLAVLLARLMMGAPGVGPARVIMLVAGALVALIILSFALPEVFDAFAGRANELDREGSSGHARFIVPWWVLGEVAHRMPWAYIIGLGPGTAESMNLPYEYGLNTPQKIVLEYGIPGLVLYMALIFTNRRTRTQSVLLWPIVFIVLQGGGLAQFSPALFPIVLLITVARLTPSDMQAPPPEVPHADTRTRR